MACFCFAYFLISAIGIPIILTMLGSDWKKSNCCIQSCSDTIPILATYVPAMQDYNVTLVAVNPSCMVGQRVTCWLPRDNASSLLLKHPFLHPFFMTLIVIATPMWLLIVLIAILLLLSSCQQVVTEMDDYDKSLEAKTSTIELAEQDKNDSCTDNSSPTSEPIVELDTDIKSLGVQNVPMYEYNVLE